MPVSRIPSTAAGANRSKSATVAQPLSDAAKTNQAVKKPLNGGKIGAGIMGGYQFDNSLADEIKVENEKEAARKQAELDKRAQLLKEAS